MIGFGCRCKPRRNMCRFRRALSPAPPAPFLWPTLLGCAPFLTLRGFAMCAASPTKQI